MFFVYTNESMLLVVHALFFYIFIYFWTIEVNVVTLIRIFLYALILSITWSHLLDNTQRTTLTIVVKMVVYRCSQVA